MFEVYYCSPENTERESRISSEVEAGGGHLDFREDTNFGLTICLTYEFAGLEQANLVLEKLRQLGEYVEGPQDYGD